METKSMIYAGLNHGRTLDTALRIAGMIREMFPILEGKLIIEVRTDKINELSARCAKLEEALGLAVKSLAHIKEPVSAHKCCEEAMKGDIDDLFNHMVDIADEALTRIKEITETAKGDCKKCRGEGYDGCQCFDPKEDE